MNIACFIHRLTEGIKVTIIVKQGKEKKCREDGPIIGREERKGEQKVRKFLVSRIICGSDSKGLDGA